MEAPPAPSRLDVTGKSGKRSAIWKRKDRALQTTAEKFQEMLKRVIGMVQRNFIEVGFCRVRYAHTAPPTLAPKWASPFFGFAHPPPFGGGETIKYRQINKKHSNQQNNVAKPKKCP